MIAMRKELKASAIFLSKNLQIVLCVFVLLMGHSAVYAESDDCEKPNPQRNAYFGDFHVHTRLSLDAWQQDTRTDPSDAYDFAKGLAIGIPPLDEEGNALQSAQISRPLDFLAVTDHAETLGESAICQNPQMDGYWSMTCIGLRWFPNMVATLILGKVSNQERMGFCGDQGERCLIAAKPLWQQIIDSAEGANQPCEFTSFVAYEWTAGTFQEGNLFANLHRNVIFKNQQVPDLPSSWVESRSAEALYDHLDKDCRNSGTGCDAVVIPHNSNISLGQMFKPVAEGGVQLTAAQAEQRASYETLFEIMQHKGASECYGGDNPLMPVDELCDFEQLPWNSFVGNTIKALAQPIRPDAGFARQALQMGLEQETSIGANPFEFGFIGSTDTHRSLAGGVEEYNFQGHGGAGSAAAETGAVGLPDQWEFNPGGLAVLYAEQNTRDALFAAMQRREAYATSGPRMQVRFFGGWDYPQELCASNDFLEQAYQGGVPMGGELNRQQNNDNAPRFAVSAQMDPGVDLQAGSLLQRIQIVKGWLDDNGKSKERVFEVAGNPDNGASVDINTCKQTGEGYGKLCAVWQDPDFDASQKAFYYTRVVENPSCRWSTYICAANKVQCDNPETIKDGLEDCCRDDIQPVIQERAWSSPIWYKP